MIQKLTKFFPIIGIVLFIYIISRINLHAVAQNFLHMDYRFLALAFLLIPCSLFVKTLKWGQLIKPFDVHLGLKEGMKAWLVGFFVGLITPGRVGDLSRAFYLKDRMPIGKALTTVVIDRVVDIFVLMVLSGIGVIFIFSHFVVKSSIIEIILAAFFAFAIGVFLFLEEKRAGKLLKPLYNFFVPDKYKDKLKSSFSDFYGGIGVLKNSKSAVMKAVALSFIAWAITFTNYFVLATAIGINVEYIFVLMIMPIVLLVEILPISFSGIGTRDATLILFFSIIGLSANSAVALSLTILMFNYIYSLAGLAVWMKHPIKL